MRLEAWVRLRVGVRLEAGVYSDGEGDFDRDDGDCDRGDGDSERGDGDGAIMTGERSFPPSSSQDDNRGERDGGGT